MHFSDLTLRVSRSLVTVFVLVVAVTGEELALQSVVGAFSSSVGITCRRDAVFTRSVRSALSRCTRRQQRGMSAGAMRAN
jgi:hypothetical protein